MDKKIVGLHVIEWAFVAVAGDVDGDQAWVLRAQLCGAEAGAFRGSRREVLDEHIGLGDDAVKQRRVVRALDVRDQRFLAAVEPDEVGALAAHKLVVAAGEVAFLALDLDDTRAGIGQARGTEGCRHRLLQRDDQ